MVLLLDWRSFFQSFLPWIITLSKRKCTLYTHPWVHLFTFQSFIQQPKMRHLLAVSYPGPARIGWCCHGLHTRAPCRGRCGSGRFLTSGTFSRARTALCATAGCPAKPAAAQKALRSGVRAVPGSSSPPHVRGPSPANMPRTQPQASSSASCFVRGFFPRIIHGAFVCNVIYSRAQLQRRAQ